MAKTKYRHAERSKSASVWFKTLDETGKVLKDYPSAPCFAQIISTSSYSGYGMHKNTKTVHVYRNKGMMPYDVPEIKRWIDDLNEMGFPCKFIYEEIEGDDTKQENWVKSTITNKTNQAIALKIRRHGGAAPVDPNAFYNFTVDLKDYEDKNHFFSTLTLIRMLSESYMDVVPEIYFNLVDADPKVDKFQALQDAHKQGNAGGGHAVTYNGNGNNISHKALMAKFKKSKADLWNGQLSINQHWHG